MVVLVAGATGNVGAELVRILADQGHPVRALHREGHPPDVPDGVETVVGDLDDPDSLTDAFAGADAAFLLPGYSDMPGVYARVREAGVGRVVQLSGGSAASRAMSNAVTAYMVRTEDALTASGLPWTILRPYAFMSNALRWRDQVQAGDVVRLPFAGVRAAYLDPQDLAAVAAVALVTDGHEGQVYAPSGPVALGPDDLVHGVGRALGRDLRFEAQPDEEAREEMLKTTPPEYVDAFFDFYVAGSLDESEPLPTVEQVTGRPPRSFAQWAEAHAHDFR